MLALLFLLHSASSAGAPTTGFLGRSGSTLISAGSPYRFAGANLYWLGLDENTGSVAQPTHFRVTDALTTVAGLLPGTTIRSHTVGISTGGPHSFEPQLGVFNGSALDAADWAIAEAERLGLRIIVPLTDNWRYFHGGKHDFTSWCGDASEADFYTLPCAVAAFKAYVRARLLHVNPYTGRPAAAEPAIAAWETGNELQAPASWTQDVAAFIKGLDANHLVLDGTLLRSAGSDHLAGCPAVDIFQTHFYPPDAAALRAAAAAAAAAGRAYVAGEYGWITGAALTYNGTTLACAGSGGNCSGSCAWSFFPHADAHGFVQHDDGFTFHYPGDTPGMRQFVGDLRASHAAMAGEPSPRPLPPPLAPAVTSAQGGALSWRGGALAAHYEVQTAPAAGGPWGGVGGAPTDDDAPWRVPGGLPAGQWVRLRGVGVEGLAGPWSDPWQA
jgi:mannan endo-1,4-beta-mannosidase